MASAAVRVLEGQVRTYGSTWRATIFVSFLAPLLYLLAMGFGLGTLIDDGVVGLEGTSYVAYLAPGLMAANAMMMGVNQGIFPVLSGTTWMRWYEGALATPVAPRDLVGGHLMFGGLRVFTSALAFGAVAAALGALEWSAVAMTSLAGSLTGLVFIPFALSYAIRLRSDFGLAPFFRLVAMPMFLFSGAFFPIAQLPTIAQVLAKALPLWHGVELARSASGVAPSAWPAFVHVAVLLAWGALALRVSQRFFDERLYA